MINPAKLLQLKNMKQQFDSNHPKFRRFVRAASKSALQEGAVIEITVTPPKGNPISANLKVQQSDLELFEAMQELMDH